MLTMDVLCVGHASYDLTFQVSHHPGDDDKIVASGFVGCGGGPAANAAMTVARAGGRAAFAGYLGRDTFGASHLAELQDAGVNTQWVLRGDSPTPLSAILAKPDGRRSLANYRGGTQPLPEGAIDFSGCRPGAILFDGHERHVSLSLARWARQEGIPTILDAGSLHAGTEALMGMVDHLVASEKFARQATGCERADAALDVLSVYAPTVVVTLGQQGLLWAKGQARGRLAAYRVDAVDTTGAGDVFHGAYALCVAQGRPWEYVLRYASAGAALSCTGLGARTAIPGRAETERLAFGVGMGSGMPTDP